MPDERTAPAGAAGVAATPAPGYTRWWRLLLLVAIVAGAIVLGRALGLGRFADPATLRATVDRLRGLRWIVPAFIGAYGIGVSLGLPATPFTFTGAALFGPVFGTLMNWLGATLAAVGGFLLARTLGHGALANAIRRRAPNLDSLVSEHGFVTVLRLRLIPVIPFVAINYGAGLAGMRLLPYTVASALGMLPATIAFTLFGDALADGVTGGGRQAMLRAAAAGVLLILVSFVPAIVAKRRKRV